MQAAVETVFSILMLGGSIWALRFQLMPVRPAVATMRPSGVIAAAFSLPSSPGPIGGRRICSSRPLPASHTRAVLSGAAVTAWRPEASTGVRRCRRDDQSRPPR